MASVMSMFIVAVGSHNGGYEEFYPLGYNAV
jgi:hypothetical protein